MKFIFIFLLTTLTYGTQSARILGIFPLPERSHYILGSTLMKELAEKGHDVTVISPFTEKFQSKNGTYTNIATEETIQNEANMFNIHYFCSFINAVSISMSSHDTIEKTLRHEDVQALIHSNTTFDVVIVEQFLNDAHKALATHFKAPLIILSTLGANFWVNPLVGNPSPPSYIPDVMLEYSSRMTFIERLENSLLYVFNELLYNFYIFPKQDELIKKYLPNGPNLNDVLYNASIVFLNSHPSTNQPVPLVPNMIEIGGFHVKPPKPLPDDVQKFLDGAEDGVIYFSMGSNLKSVHFPEEKLKAIIGTFSKLKEKVLWKWEDNDFPGKLDNVMFGKWLPQQDILAHPNVKLFISHGGHLSMTEAIYHGVPLLIIPAFGDQYLNAKFAIDNGYGALVSYKEISEEVLMKEIKNVLNDSRYRYNVKRTSQIFHDRLVKPLEKAVYWVEYVIRHKGAPHLRVAALDLPWYKYHLLDVIGLMMFIIFFTNVCIYYIFKYFFKCVTSPKNIKKVKKH